MKTFFLTLLILSQVLNAQNSKNIVFKEDPLIVFYQQSLDRSSDYLVDNSYVFGRIHLLNTKIRIALEGKDSGYTGFVHPHLIECNDVDCKLFKEVILQTFIIWQSPDNKGFAIYLVNPLLDDSWITFEVDYEAKNSMIYTRYYYSLGICLRENLSEDVYENNILRANDITDIEPVQVHSLHQIAFIESLFEFYLDKSQEGNFIQNNDICNLNRQN